MTAPTSGQHSERSDGDLGAPSERSCTCGLADEKDGVFHVDGMYDVDGTWCEPVTFTIPARTHHFWDCAAKTPEMILQDIQRAFRFDRFGDLTE